MHKKHLPIRPHFAHIHTNDAVNFRLTYDIEVLCVIKCILSIMLYSILLRKREKM